VRIGFLSQALPYLPSRGGFRLYGANLIRVLSRRHEIHLVSLLADDDADHLDWARRYCASVETIPVRSAGRLLTPLSLLSAHLWGRPLRHRWRVARTLRSRARDWDVLHVEGGYAGGLVPDDLPVPGILSLHDSWTLRCDEMIACARGLGERLYYALLARHEPRYERLVYPRFECCTLVSERDREAVRRVVPAATLAVVPYGIDTEHYAPVAGVEPNGTVVFHGHLGYAPNIDAALEFADRIFPIVRRALPGLDFHIVAADPVARIRALAARPGIRLTISPPDVRPALAAARVYACPMRHGTGMKNKVLEAMAMALPVVCYPPAIAGIDCVPGVHVLVAEDPDTFAQHVVDLVRDPSRAEKLGRAGRTLVEERYGWEERARAFEDLYDRAIGRRLSRARQRTEGHRS
jgi:glycosyltransferase involved in cell wall biosynthesis